MSVSSISAGKQFKVAEFFAGVGLAKVGLERGSFEVVWSNDFDARKRRVFGAIHGSAHPFDPRDIAAIDHTDIPDIDVAWASFPCTDLSQAGLRAGIRGKASGAYWHFSRILGAMGARAPRLIVIENVGGFVSGNEGRDLGLVLEDLKDIGYDLDVMSLDAAHFVPQSRPRLFIIGVRKGLLAAQRRVETVNTTRPSSLSHLLSNDLIWRAPATPQFETSESFSALAKRAESGTDVMWWEPEAVQRAISSLSAKQLARIRELQAVPSFSYRTGYRRMRAGKATWEFRADHLAGCLRTPKGGSSVQAVLRAGYGRIDLRWMLAGEYAELMGVEASKTSHLGRSDQLWAFGDAVCVPVVEWLAKEYLMPLMAEMNNAGETTYDGALAG